MCAGDRGDDRVGRDRDVGDVVWSHFLCEGCQYMDSIIKSYLQRTIARDESGHRCETEMIKDDPVGYSPIQVLLYETVEAMHLCHCKWQGRVENVCRCTLMRFWCFCKNLLDRRKSVGGKGKSDEHVWCRSSDVVGDG